MEFEEKTGGGNAGGVDGEEVGALGVDDEGLERGVMLAGDDRGGGEGEEKAAVFWCR